MKNILAVLAVMALSLAVTGQSRNAPSKNQSPVSHSDLNLTLADLEKAAGATQSDIAHLRIDKWGSGLKPGFMGKNSHAREAQQTAASLRRNLVSALPGLIGDVRASRGSMAASFKLYDDVSVVCETLDSLVTATETYGKKEEYGPLAEDFSAMARVRRSLSSYIEMKAEALEGKSPATLASRQAVTPALKSSAAPAPRKNRTIVADDARQPSAAQPANSQQLPKKIIVDDNVPDQKPVKKKAAVQYSNQ